MIQKYKFEGENDFIEFDDSKSVKELINYAFDKFDYFEPAGIEIVTLFQCHHPIAVQDGLLLIPVKNARKKSLIEKDCVLHIICQMCFILLKVVGDII